LILLQQIRVLGDRGRTRILSTRLPVDVKTEGAIFIDSLPRKNAISLADHLVVIKGSRILQDRSFLEGLLSLHEDLEYAAIGILSDTDIDTSRIISLFGGRRPSFPVLLLPSSEVKKDNFSFSIEGYGKQDFPELSGDFREFADIIFGDGKIESVVKRLARILGHDVAYRDLFRKNSAIASTSENFSESLKLYPLKEILRIFPCCEISHRERKMGYLVANPDQGAFIDISLRELGIIGNAIIAIRLIAEKQIQYLDLEKKYRDQLVKDLLYNRVRSLEEVENRAHTFGWKFENRVVAMVISPRISGEEELYGEKSDDPSLDTELVKSRVRVFFPYVAYAEVANSLVFLISPAAGDERAKRMDSFYETVRQISSEINSVIHDPVSIAAGGFRDNILNVGESYMEAQRALKVLRTYSLDDNIAIWDRLGSYKLLSTLDTYSEASQFFLRELSPLLDYDRQHNSDLLETLYAIDRNNWNLSSTASEINVHYNTMKYRYKNIAEILSVDLEDSENRFNIALALRLYKMSRA